MLIIQYSLNIFYHIAPEKGNDSELSKSDSTVSAISNQSKVSTHNVNPVQDTSIDTKLDQFGQQMNDSITQLVAKEHFVFTDPEGQLYHFSVEGNTIRDGTKVYKTYFLKIT